MTADKMDLLKLDSGLAEIFGLRYLDDDSGIPVILRGADSDISKIVAVVEENRGAVRHLLEPIDAVAALVPFGSLRELIRTPLISEIELDQVSHIA